MTTHDPTELREIKRLTAQATSHVGDSCQGCVDLAMAVNLLIGLVEGHRHSYVTFGGKRDTGPMQAMEGRDV